MTIAVATFLPSCNSLVGAEKGRERQLLYVTLTRERDLASVTWVGEPSSYVGKTRIGTAS